MKYQLLNALKLLLLISIVSFTTSAFAALDIEISGGSAQQIPVAIVPFGQEAGQREKISQIVGADLLRSGLFKILETRGMVDLPNNASQINFPQWQALQAQALTIGNIETVNSRQLKVTFELIDVFKQTRLMALEYTVAPAQLRMTAHKIADAVYTKLTGEGGMFASRIAYINKTSSRYSLMVADVDGANPVAVAFSKEPIISPSWSPDGSSIAYVSFERKKPIIYIQSLTTGKRLLLANFKGNNSAPSWSPDGSELAIVLTYASNSQIYTINADGSGVKRIVRSNGIDTQPTWSKDGSTIYFSSNRGGRPQIYKVASTGGAVSRVTYDGAYNVSPRLSPDGRYLATIRNDGGSFKVALQDLVTGQVQLLSQGAKDESPSFSPNGRVLLYATSRGGRGSLAAVSSDGSVRQRLKESGGDVREPAWGPLIK